MFDLHTHSTHSDGHLSVEELIKKAELANIKYLALTDHDVVSGLPQFLSCKSSINRIPGVEITTEYKGGHEVHIVALFLDYEQNSFKRLIQKNSAFRVNRNRKLKTDIEKYFNIKLDLDAEREGATRGNFANELINKGFGSNYNEIFSKYLGTKGIFHMPQKRVSTLEAVEAIHSANGVAIIAHPAIYRFKSPYAFIKSLKKLGVDGVEVYTSSHTIAQAKQYYALAKKFQMLISIGSDCHGVGERSHFSFEVKNMYKPSDLNWVLQYFK